MWGIQSLKKNSDPLKRHFYLVQSRKGNILGKIQIVIIYYIGHSDGGFLKDKPNIAI